MNLGLMALLLLATLLIGTGCSAQPQEPTPDLRFHRQILPPEQNAFLEWERADAAFVELPPEVKQPMAVAWSLDNEQLTPEQIDLIKPWLLTNATALRLLETSLNKEKAQIPPWNPVDTGPFMRAPFELAKLRLFQAEEAAIAGDHHTATNLLLGNVKFARMLRDAEVPIIHYLVARACRTFTEKALVRWAHFSGADAGMLRAVLNQLPDLADEPDAYEQVLRVEFTDFLTRDHDIIEMGRRWVETVRTNDFALSMQPEELQRPLLLIMDPQLLQEHPKPLDIAEQTQFFARRFHAFNKAVRAPWSQSNYFALLEQTDAVRADFLSDLEPLLSATEDDTLPLNPTRAGKVIKHYRKVKNPIGRYYQANDNLTRTFVYTFQARTERSATRTLLALRIYQLKQGKLPGSLEDLVQAGLLSSVPIDFFSNAPLRYSAEKRILWSVGENGEDNGGIAGGKGYRFWAENDAVWSVR